MKTSAVISECGLYRYWLSRVWNPDRSNAVFVMLNPSTADAEKDDPTIRRCTGFARDWGCGGIEVVNLFAFRATNPNALHDAANPVGPDNDEYIRKAVRHTRPVIAAWGVMGTYRNRERIVLDMLAGDHVLVRCLGTTKGGRPRHPLYVPGNQEPIPFEVPGRRWHPTEDVQDDDRPEPPAPNGNLFDGGPPEDTKALRR